jgi:predicted helicase
MPEYRDALRNIRSFPSLIKFLRDELDWPISSDDFEELTFDYTPEELGIDQANAAKIQEIKRLRPLSVTQPWGIFFVKFEPKQLPVVALRRILSRVVMKKRASANSADRAAWQMDDLLFISNYGDGEERRISLAHFSQDKQKNDLPTLKVLGWDNLDTPLHLDNVAEKLSERLSWPEDEDDTESWREGWQSAFTLRHREVITTSQALAVRLAELARAIRDRIKTVLTIETENGPVTNLMASFKQALVHDLDEDSFADMYAQTIAYGLLSARIEHPDSRTADDFAAQMPVTNPFLKELMETFLDVGGRKGKAGSNTGIDFDELGVNEVVELLDDANMEAVVLDFGDRNPLEDPVIHFYELFLKEYDVEQKVKRGVFYTPRPVVSFITRSVDELLRTEFGLEDGLADTATWGDMAKRNKELNIPKGTSREQAFVQILDPATGTGTFLVEVIDLIYRTMLEKWREQGEDDKKIEVLWNEYVPRHLLPRLHGYELLMAPYAIAHLKIGLKLYETGYHFGSSERARVYLTNALEPAHDFSSTFEFIIPALAHEAQAVNEIKQNQQFTVVIGNPPYSGRSYNLTASARAMVERYKTIAGEQIKEKGALQLEKNLNDDYVKFICLTQILTENHPAVAGLITNHSFLENLTLRGLRWHLLEQYSHITLLDLGGNVARREKGEDENVFDITQGVAISLFASPPKSSAVVVDINRLRGRRDEKYESLSHGNTALLQFTHTAPVGPLFLFRSEDASVRTEYYSGTGLTELFPLNSTGVKTHRDAFCIDFDLAPLKQRIADLVALELSDDEIREKYGLSDTHGWALEPCRRKLRSDPNWENAFTRVLYRPFDWRHIYFSPNVVELARMEVSENFLHDKNIGLIFMRQVASDEPYTHFLVTRDPVDNRCFYSNRGTMSFAPLFMDEFSHADNVLSAGVLQNKRVPNLRVEAIQNFHDVLGKAEFEQMPMETVVDYIYGVFHSTLYRSYYAEFLKVDFPRFPFPGSPNLFYELARFGRKLVDIHLMESPKLDELITNIIGSEKLTVGRVGWSEDTVWLNATKTEAKKGYRASNPGTVGFYGVPEQIWDFKIGGYQVCHKWLKDRKGRLLADEDLLHYQKIIVAISETIRIMGEIDDVIEKYGGLPGAFANNNN